MCEKLHNMWMIKSISYSRIKEIVNSAVVNTTCHDKNGWFDHTTMDLLRKTLKNIIDGRVKGLSAEGQLQPASAVSSIWSIV